MFPVFIHEYLRDNQKFKSTVKDKKYKEIQQYQLGLERLN